MRFSAFKSATFTEIIGLRRYEISNHLGNVLATYTDRKLWRRLELQDGSKWEGYDCDVASGTDYHAYGFAMAGRTWEGGGAYRYGMNTQEKSPEIGDGHYTAQFWEYDSGLARRWELDPVEIVGVSRYSCFGGNPIVATDPSGATVTDPHKIVERVENEAKSNIAGLTVRIETANAKLSASTPGTTEYKALESEIAQMEVDLNENRAVLSELEELRASKQNYTVFDYSENKEGDTVSEPGKGQGQTFFTESGDVFVVVSWQVSKGQAIQIAAHELKHAFQIERRQLTAGIMFYDLNDEAEAFQRNRIFGSHDMIDFREAYKGLSETPKSMGEADIRKAAEYAHYLGKKGVVMSPKNSNHKNYMMRGYIDYWNMGKNNQAFKFEE